MELIRERTEPLMEEMESPKKKVNLKIIFAITLLVAIIAGISIAFQANQLRQQLVKQESQLLVLKNSNGILERQLQEANLKLTALTSANSFLEKNNERLYAIREFLQDQLNRINEQLALQKEIISVQQEIISSLKEVNGKLDTVLSQLSYLYVQSTGADASKDRKGKVEVQLSPAEETQ